MSACFDEMNTDSCRRQYFCSVPDEYDSVAFLLPMVVHFSRSFFVVCSNRTHVMFLLSSEDRITCYGRSRFAETMLPQHIWRYFRSASAQRWQRNRNQMQDISSSLHFRLHATSNCHRFRFCVLSSQATSTLQFRIHITYNNRRQHIILSFLIQAPELA